MVPQRELPQETVRGKVKWMQPACTHVPPCSCHPAGSFLDQQPLLQPLVSDEAAYGHAFEMPSINPNNVGRPYRWVAGGRLGLGWAGPGHACEQECQQISSC